VWINSFHASAAFRRRLGDSGVAFPKGAAKVVAEGDVPLSDEEDDEEAAAAATDKQQQQQRPLHPDEELEQQQAAEAAEAEAAEHSDDEPDHRPEGGLYVGQACSLQPAFCCWSEPACTAALQGLASVHSARKVLLSLAI
jgi:hypothetical protein